MDMNPSELRCDHCDKQLGWCDVFDNEGSYFYCTLECTSLHRVILAEKHKERKEWEDAEWARRLAEGKMI